MLRRIPPKKKKNTTHIGVSVKNLNIFIDSTISKVEIQKILQKTKADFRVRNNF